MVQATDQFVVETVGLTKRFRDFWGHTRVVAVDNLDVSITPGEVFGLLGPNGSGKSTTIKMLLGLLFPSRGVAKVLGHPPGEVKINHRIGYLPEESYLYPFLNARETLDFYGRIFSLPRVERQRRINSLLEMVGLSSTARRPIGEFSKGMARRIGLAQALINDPDLLILDEPTSGLDPLGTRQIKDLIGELGRRGKTVLLCSHLLADVEDVCDRIGIMYGGKLRQMGRMNDLLTDTDVTQIRSKHLTPEIIEKISALIQDDQLQVQAPRERLEDYFLRIVQEAQAEQIATSGALMGGAVSDFLSSSQPQPAGGEVIIDQLVSGKEIDEPVASQQAATTSVAPTVAPVKQDVVDSLTGQAGDQPLTTPIKPEVIEASRDESLPVDLSLINQLTGKKPADQDENKNEGSDDQNSNRSDKG